jgi:hypothetical protein
VPDYFSQQVNKLEELARQEFGTLSDAEMRVLRGTANGECTTCHMTGGVLGDNPADADSWGPEREVRAELIRWLCIAPEASKVVAPLGVQVRGAKVSGSLDLSSVSVPFPVTCIQCRLGDIDVKYATIPLLNLTGSAIDTLTADGAEFKSMLILSQGFSARDVRLAGVTIGGSLDLQNATLKSVGVGFHADRLEVKGDVVLYGFSSDGNMEMLGGEIGGVMGCDGARFAGLTLQRTKIKGSLFWRGIQKCTFLDLSDASTGNLSDDEKSWEQTGEFILDGFVYNQIIGIDSSKDVEVRLRWLRRQRIFAPQPYRQLAKFFREIGYEDSAKDVVFELESRLREAERERLFHGHLMRWSVDSSGDAISWATIGYGVHPGLAVIESIGLAGLGWIIFRRAYRAGSMVPSDEKACDSFRKGHVPKHYRAFTPLIYSVENCIPLVKLGQDEKWEPDPDPTLQNLGIPPELHSKYTAPTSRVLDFIVSWVPGYIVTPRKVKWYRWIMIVLGWLLATFFVAGLSGLIKTG